MTQLVQAEPYNLAFDVNNIAKLETNYMTKSVDIDFFRGEPLTLLPPSGQDVDTFFTALFAKINAAREQTPIASEVHAVSFNRSPCYR